MDGNGRWATARNLPRSFGHQAGAETVRTITTHTITRGIPYLTLYAFSTENWARPQAEVDALMLLLAHFINHELQSMLDNNIRLRIIGDAAPLSRELQDELLSAQSATRDNGGLTLTLAINYGGRDEIIRAVRRMAAELLHEENSPDAIPGRITEALLQKHLDTGDVPDPDLIIRTAGEQRLSNFLVWQAAYAELYFTETRWPDFSPADYDRALEEYARRTRNFGGIAKES